jgi:hypothetical protein
VEWLDVGPADPPQGSTVRYRRRRRWYLLTAAVALALLLVASVQHGTKHSTATPSHRATATAPPRSPPATSSPSAPSIAVTDAGHRLLDVPADWELFGLGAGVVVRIEIARGRVTRTVVPFLDSAGGISFVAGSDRVIIRPFGEANGYEVPDGHAGRELPAALEQQGPALPGPDRGQLWVPSGSDESVMTLVGFDGRPAGTSITVPDSAPAISDAAGYLLFYASGGVYDLRPGRITRITTGALLATGPTRWLTHDCDVHYRCATTVTDRTSGARRVLSTPGGVFGNDGVIAPDGATAAMIGVEDAGLTLHLLDLATGVDRPTGVVLDPVNSFGGGKVVWSPDSRWLFAVDANGRVVVIDPAARRTADLGVPLPPLTEIALRTRSP